MTIKQKQQQKGRGLGGKRCVRKMISLTNDLDQKSKMLATSCNMSQAELLYTLLEVSLSNTSIIKFVQDKYNINEKYRVLPVHVNGKLYYQ